MTSTYRATAEQWERMEAWASEPNLQPYAVIALELRSRIEALEKHRHHGEPSLPVLEAGPAPSPAADTGILWGQTDQWGVKHGVGSGTAETEPRVFNFTEDYLNSRVADYIFETRRRETMLPFVAWLKSVS